MQSSLAILGDEINVRSLNEGFPRIFMAITAISLATTFSQTWKIFDNRLEELLPLPGLALQQVATVRVMGDKTAFLARTERFFKREYTIIQKSGSQIIVFGNPVARNLSWGNYSGMILLGLDRVKQPNPEFTGRTATEVPPRHFYSW